MFEALTIAIWISGFCWFWFEGIAAVKRVEREMREDVRCGRTTAAEKKARENDGK